MNNKQRLLIWLLLVVGATVIVIIVSLFVVKLPDPWNWLVPLAFLVLTNIVGFLADILEIRSALFEEKPAPESVTEIEDSHDVVIGEKITWGNEIKPTITDVDGEVVVAKEVIQASGDVLQAGRDIVLQGYHTPTRAKRVHVPPAAQHPLFGRDDELAQITAVLCGRRSVLLHGMGGIGKTVLAGEVAQRLHADTVFEDGILWVSEIGMTPIDALCGAIARSLGDEEIPKLLPNAKLDPTRELLAAHNLLLILDNLADPNTAQTFLDHCRPASLGVLATSRHRHLGFDKEIPVRPLTRDAAIALFRDRANMPTANGKVDEICDLLGDHPLALVIAAGRIRAEAMPLSRLYTRLADEKERFRTLKLGKDEDKDRNVWASLNLSYEDLSGDQRQVFIHLAACFGDSTGLELLAEICGMSQTECEDHLGRLVARSLVEREGDRIALHQLVRDFGRDILDTDLPTIRNQVLEAMQAYATRYSNNTPEEHDKLEAELGNLVNALRYAAYRKAWRIVTGLVDPLTYGGVLNSRGYWSDLVAVGQLGILAVEESGDERALAALTHNVAVTLGKQGNYDEAHRLLLQSLEISEQLGNRRGMAVCLLNLGVVAQDQGNHSEARRHLLESLEIYEKLGDQIGIAISLQNLGVIAQDQRDYGEARHFFLKSLEIFEELGDPDGIAGCLINLGGIAQDQGDYDEARRLYQYGLEINKKLGDQASIASCLHNLGRIALLQGEYDEARHLFHQSLEIKKKLGNQAGIANTLHELGVIVKDQGGYDEARRLFHQSLKIKEELRDRKGIALTLWGLAMINQAQGYVAEAQHQYEEALFAFQKLGDKKNEAGVLNQLGQIAQQQKAYDEAAGLHLRSLKIKEELRDQDGVAHSLFNLGVIAQTQGNYDEAHRRFRESLEIWERLRNQAGIASCLHNLGLITQDQGRYDEARRFFQQSLKIFDRLQSPMAEAARRNLARLEEMAESGRRR